MSIEEKRRSAFEAWAEAHRYNLRRDGVVVDYASPQVDAMWQAWNASLDSVVIELPKSKSTHFSEEDGDYDYPLRAEGFNDAISEFRERIESAGLKVKP